MNEHRAAIETSHRNERIATAETSDEKKLASVEQAVIASKTELAELADELNELVENQRITAVVAEERMSARRAEHATLIDKLKTDIVDPIAAKIEVIEPGLPESDGNHREARADYEAMTEDERSHALIKAMRGDDPVMAVALLGGRRWFSDTTRNKLLAAITPEAVKEKQRSTAKLDKKVRGTLSTIEGAGHD